MLLIFLQKSVDSTFLDFYLNSLDFKLDILHQEVLFLNVTLYELLSPVEDGLPISFYLAFWHILKDDLLLLYKEVFSVDKLPLGEGGLCL